jgi:hypothetical protein
MQAHGGIDRWRAFARGPGSRAIRDLLMISIDPSDFRVDKHRVK